MSKDHLSIYLNDHLAGSNIALEILEHLAAEAPDLSSPLAALKKEIAEDRHQLTTLMARLHIAESRVRKAGAWIAEGLAEVKLDAEDEQGGPLRRLERLEALALGIEGKITLWSALDAAASSNNKLVGLDYGRLTERAQDQRSRIEVWRLEAARAALL
jgi:hypothetical protein